MDLEDLAPDDQKYFLLFFSRQAMRVELSTPMCCLSHSLKAPTVSMTRPLAAVTRSMHSVSFPASYW